MAARRELFEETGITLQRMEQLCTVGTPGRDPRGWTITIVYMAVIGKDDVATFHLQAASDAEEACWFDTFELPQVAFDHADIIDRALSHLGLLPA
jgi:8-oxo-dGTP diphosphatase